MNSKKLINQASKLAFTLFTFSTITAANLALSSQASAESNLIQNVLNALVDKKSLTESVPPIAVGGLENFKGQYLHVYYVVGQTQFLDQKRQIHVREMKRIDMVTINQNEINLPSVHVAKKTIFAAYNYVILVVSKTPEHTLYNPNGTIAPGQPESATQPDDSSVYKVAISKAELLGPSMPAGIYEPGQPVPKNLVPFKINL
jgi:hypothetical protein